MGAGWLPWPGMVSRLPHCMERIKSKWQGLQKTVSFISQQAGAELGQAKLKLGLALFYFTSIKLMS